jgi:pimeloyl-ACP methyl ester carboxylesterase
MESIRGPAPFEASDVPVPVVAGCGSASEARHRESAERLADTIPAAELMVIEGAGHGAHLSHPKEFAGFVRRVLERGGLA